MNDELMGVGDACKLWHLGRSTIKRKCIDGTIKAEKVSGRWLIYKDQDKPKDERERNKNERNGH